MPTQHLPEYHSAVLACHKNQWDPFLNTLWDLSAAQPYPLLGLPKHNLPPSTRPISSIWKRWPLLPAPRSFRAGQESGWQHSPKAAPSRPGQPLAPRGYPSPTVLGWPWEPSPHHSTQISFILSRSGSEEQSRAHSTLCRQEAREEARYVPAGTSWAGAARARQDPVATPARYHLRRVCALSCTPSSFLGAS